MYVQLPPALESKTILRIVVREIHTKAILEKLGKDLVMAYEALYERHGLLSEDQQAALEAAAAAKGGRRRMSLVPALDLKALEMREKDEEKATGKSACATGKADEETYSSVC